MPAVGARPGGMLLLHYCYNAPPLAPPPPMNLLRRSPAAGLVRAALLILAVIALTSCFIGDMWTDSVDLAHHYALVVRLMEYGNAPFPYDPSLGEMNVYPRLAHQMAASVGRLWSSPLMGMQALAVLSMVLAWAGLSWLVSSLPQRTAAIAALALAALFAVNRYAVHMPLQGDELVQNFFYPQLLGQTLFIAIILLNLYLEKKAVAAWLRYGLLVPAVYLLAGVHLLPAVTLLAMMGLMICAELLVMWRRGRPGLAATGAIGAGLLLSALGALISHPAFAVMQEISKQNGNIPLRHLDSTVALMSYSGVVALASVALLLYWARPQRERSFMALKYIGLYGLAVSGLCLAQWLAWLLGFGSEYAMRKYVFSLDTVALIELALLPALLLSRGAEAAGTRWYAVLQYCVLPAALTALACLTIGSMPVVLPTQRLVALESGVKSLQERLGRPETGKYDYVIGVNNSSAVIEYMMSIGQLRLARFESVNAASLLFKRDIADWSAVDRIVTAEKGAFDHYPVCRIGTPVGGLVALKAECLVGRIRGTTRIELTDANKIFVCSTHGMSGREGGGSWTDSREATLRCPLPQVGGKTPGRVDVEVVAFRGDIASMRALVGVEGQPLRQLTVGGSATQTLSLPLGGQAAREVVIRFELPDVRSPQELGLSNDTRKLGLLVRAIEFKD